LSFKYIPILEQNETRSKISLLVLAARELDPPSGGAFSLSKGLEIDRTEIRYSIL